MWQVVHEELRDRGLQIIAVALDTAGREAVEAKVRPTDPDRLPEAIRRLRGWSPEQWGRSAPPEFPCLIDEGHVVAELYGMVNVPMAVWIDEEGRIVRPTEPAGVNDHFRRMDPETFAIPDEDAEPLEVDRRRYVDALRDWVAKGPQSEFALAPEEVRARLHRPGEDELRAAAHARIAAHLYRAGDAEAAKQHLGEALRLNPQAWTYRRQRMVLDAETVGQIDVSDGYYEAVDALGEGGFYPAIDMPGMSERPAWLSPSGG